MQTFLVNWELSQNAALLDGKRLFKQALEAKQILSTLLNNGSAKIGWRNHPAVRQWKGYEVGLAMYFVSIWNECQKRKIAPKSDLFNQVLALIGDRVKNYPENTPIFPKWWGREDISTSHRSRLKAKGLIDIYCAAIKKSLKIKSIDKWLKGKYGKTKNQLRYSDALVLGAFMGMQGIPLPTNNHYDIPVWENVPYGLDYIWGENKP